MTAPRLPHVAVGIAVTHAQDDGVPDEASIRFAKDLDSGYVFRAWNGSELVPFALPRVGETVSFPGRIPDPLR